MTLAMFYRCDHGGLVKLDEIVGTEVRKARPGMDAHWRLMLSGGSWVDVSQDDYAMIVGLLDERMGLV